MLNPMGFFCECRKGQTENENKKIATNRNKS